MSVEGLSKVALGLKTMTHKSTGENRTFLAVKLDGNEFTVSQEQVREVIMETIMLMTIALEVDHGHMDRETVEKWTAEDMDKWWMSYLKDNACGMFEHICKNTSSEQTN